MTFIEMKNADECPHCGHEGYSTDEQEYDDYEAWVRVSCDHCGNMWFLVFKYSHAEYELESQE